MKTRLYYVLYTIVVCMASSCSKEASNTTGTIEAESVIAIEQELLKVVNAHRIEIGNSVLEFSSVAYEYAGKHTDYMISRGDLNHDNFSNRASDITTKVDAEFVAENIAKDYADASSVFQSWLKSSSHRKTIEGEFTHTAVSVKKDNKGNLYFTQLFYR
ncbi:MAG: CAP domain-containing protein [Flavobacteriaceae bacterium]